MLHAPNETKAVSAIHVPLKFVPEDKSSAGKEVSPEQERHVPVNSVPLERSNSLGKFSSEVHDRQQA